jgi:hypothetical protein
MYGSASVIESSVLCFLEIRSFALGDRGPESVYVSEYGRYRKRVDAQYDLGALTINSVVIDVVEMAALLKTLVDAMRSHDAKVQAEWGAAHAFEEERGRGSPLRESLRLACSGLMLTREFLGTQLSFQLGKLTEDEFNLRKREYLAALDATESAIQDMFLADSESESSGEAADSSTAFPPGSGVRLGVTPMPVPGLADWVVKARPMSTYDELLREAREQRYRPGTGPWSKEEDLDQVDLVDFEEMIKNYRVLSDTRGLLSCCVRRLVEEVRRAKKYPTPPEITPVYEYKKSEVAPMKERVCSAFGFEQDGNKGEEER